MKVGEVIKLADNKRDLYLNRIGGLFVEILEIDKREKLTFAKVKIIATGNITNILI